MHRRFVKGLPPGAVVVYVYGQTDEESFFGFGLLFHAPIGVFLVAPMASNHGLCGRGSSNEKNDFPDKVLTSRDLL